MRIGPMACRRIAASIERCGRRRIALGSARRVGERRLGRKRCECAARKGSLRVARLCFRPGTKSRLICLFTFAASYRKLRGHSRLEPAPDAACRTIHCAGFDTSGARMRPYRTVNTPHSRAWHEDSGDYVRKRLCEGGGRACPELKTTLRALPDCKPGYGI
jgi:hypothetical protein